MDKITTAEDQAELLKKIPVETIEIDENGHYDPKKHPEFHDWMVKQIVVNNPAEIKEAAQNLDKDQGCTTTCSMAFLNWRIIKAPTF